jgi:hypothetical protein
MTDYVRMIAIGGVVGGVVAGGLAAPAVFASVQDVPAKVAAATTISDLFPAPFDPKGLRKYAITFDDSVSTDAQHADTITKISFGHKTLVSIVTTLSGTYSTDAIASPYVRYPGVEVSPKHRPRDDGYWFHTAVSNWGTLTSSGFSSGSFVYYTSTFTPVKR